MATSAQIPGKCTVKVDSGGGLTPLGVSRGGVRLTENVRTLDVSGDARGGDEGTPLDVQYLGRTITVSANLSTWDAAEMARLQNRIRSGVTSPGVISDSDYGRLMIGDGEALRLVLVCDSDPDNFNRNFPVAIARFAIELNLGTRSAEAAVKFECHVDGDGVLWDTNVS